MICVGYKPVSRYVSELLQAPRVIDVGFRGSATDPEPIVSWAVGVDTDYPGYDGIHLPFADESQDVIFASHCLEHIEDPDNALRDWYRTIKNHGHVVILVPHQHLYERKAAPPSRFTGDHRRFYTPISLLGEFERAFPVGGWRLRSLRDFDEGFDYTVSSSQHARGQCEIEAVVEKIPVPNYARHLIEIPEVKILVQSFSSIVFRGIKAIRERDFEAIENARSALVAMPLPPYRRLALELDEPRAPLQDIRLLLAPVLASAPFDEDWYLSNYPDIGQAVANGQLESGRAHFLSGGYFEGRLPGPLPELFR